MENKRLWSVVMVLVMVFTSLLSIGSMAQAESDMKSLKVNNTTLEFKEIIYVDGNNGNDITGDGSEEKPYATVVKGIDHLNEYCREDGAVVIGNGEYDVKELFTGGNHNLNTKYNKLKISLLAKNLGKVRFNNCHDLMLAELDPSMRVKFKIYGVDINIPNAHAGIAGDDWCNEFYNCVFSGYYCGYSYVIKEASGYFENCLFSGEATINHTVSPITGKAINCASTTQYIEPYNGIKESPLYNISVDSEYNIVSGGWQNAGTGTNPDGTQAHIGVYGGRFAWKVEDNSDKNELDMVLEVEEKLLLSVDDYLSENINMTWTSSDESVATVDKNGIVTALKPGETTIKAKEKNGKYEDIINILVVEDANDYRLAVDLQVGESCRATIDKNKHVTKVEWAAADEKVAIVTATDENGQEVGRVYIRVR